MSHYDSALSLREARARHFEASGLGEGGLRPEVGAARRDLLAAWVLNLYLIVYGIGSRIL